MQMTVEAVFTGAGGVVQCLITKREVEKPAEAGTIELEELGLALTVSRYYPEQGVLGVLVSRDQFSVLAGHSAWSRP